MSEQTNAELIAEANRALAENQWTSGWGVESLAERLASALEAAEKRATYPEAERSFLSVEWERVAKSQRQTINRLEQEKAEVWRVAADELEALRIERDNWKLSASETERAEKRWRYRAEDAERQHRLSQQAWAETLSDRNQLAAVVEKAGRVLTTDYHGSPAEADVLPILATVPADALREHDAALIEKLADELDLALYEDIPHGSAIRFHYEAWLREKARQRRGGQA